MENKEPKTLKRESYLSWDEYFMAIAFLSAQRSKDPNTQVGACIVSEDKKIVGIGYNGFPWGCSDDIFPWSRNEKDQLDNKYLYVCHAELNAIMNKNDGNLKGCTIYVSLFPCCECAKLIIQSGIKHIKYYSDKYRDQPGYVASRKMLEAANVSHRQFYPMKDKIVIDFTSLQIAP